MENYPLDFTSNAGLLDRQATFALDYSNRWQDLFEMFEETGEQRYLEAAYLGAKQFVLWTRSNPMAPDSPILVNEGGNVPGVFPGRRFKANSYEWKEYDTSTDVAEQKVPAWRTSLVGLPPEQPHTYVYGPIMLHHQAAPMLRLAHLKNNSLLRDAAYNGLLGRYANFPGYYFTSLATTVYQQPDYPLHDYFEIKYNAMFYNHIWPHIALLQDFLVSDAYYRSGGKINFPSLYAPGYAFLISKVYGHAAGEVFGNKNVHLWLPKNAIQTSEIALNYLLGRDSNNTYLVLMNTAGQALSTQLFLNPDVLKWNYGHEYPVTTYQEDGKEGKGSFRNGKLQVDVPAQGLIALKIEGLKNTVPLQENVLVGEEKGLNGGYFRKEYAQESLGTITGMLIRLVPDFTDAYIYTNATEKTTQSVTLRYKIGEDAWQDITDTSYPFEFSIRNNKPDTPIRTQWKAKDLHGNIFETEELILKQAPDN
jgi:hypothetical protein